MTAAGKREGQVRCTGEYELVRTVNQRLERTRRDTCNCGLSDSTLGGRHGNDLFHVADAALLRKSALHARKLRRRPRARETLSQVSAELHRELKPFLPRGSHGADTAA